MIFFFNHPSTVLALHNFNLNALLYCSQVKFSLPRSWAKVWKCLRDKGVMKHWFKITYTFLLGRSLQFFISQLSLRHKTSLFKKKIPSSKHNNFFSCCRLLLTMFKVIGYNWSYNSLCRHICCLVKVLLAKKYLQIITRHSFMRNSGVLFSCCSQGIQLHEVKLFHIGVGLCFFCLFISLEACQAKFALIVCCRIKPFPFFPLL